MIEKITLDALTSEGVSLKRQQYTIVGGKEYPIGEPWRKGYVNSTIGRDQVQAEIPEPYQTAIFAVWGEASTVAE